jgi:hypothetical protein
MSVQVKPGTRLRSAVCGTEVVVVRASAGEIDLRCGGHPMLPLDATPPAGLAALPGYDEPTALGKRYTDPAETVELLCTVGGPSALSAGDARLEIKGAKPLPASD